jgi:hypothetical protein
MQTPISVGDLPSYKYCVSTRTITEEATSYLETHPEIPGVILLQDGIFHSAIPRTSMFERLGHRYGIELFLRKPIIELQQNLQVKALAISSNLRIKEAVENALQRDADSMYAPLVVSHNDGDTRLLDMYTLLTAQSHILDNANSIFGRMNAIEDALQAKLPFDKLFDMVMDSMMSVVPYHRAGLFISPSRWMKLSFTHPLVHRMSDKMRETRLFQTISDLRQPVVVEDIQAHPYRHALDSLGSVRAWIGLPLQTIFGVEGVLSLSRFSLTAFTREEIELAKSFIDYFGLVLNEPPDPQTRSISLEKTRRRLSLLAGG